jgi:hypothetical protein
VARCRAHEDRGQLPGQATRRQKSSVYVVFARNKRNSLAFFNLLTEDEK